MSVIRRTSDAAQAAKQVSYHSASVTRAPADAKRSAAGDIGSRDVTMIVSKGDRLNVLRDLNLSEPVLKLASGQCIHTAFEYCCESLYEIYHGGEGPTGLTIAPLWQHGDSVTAVDLTTQGQVRFLEFSIEGPDEYWVLATTEQGMLGQLFISLLERAYEPDELEEVRQAAQVVGFKHLDLLQTIYEGSCSDKQYEERVRKTIAAIDEMSGGLQTTTPN